MFLHNHAFTFLVLAVTAVLNEIAELEFPLSGVLYFVMFLLWCWLPYYVYRSMRVVYGNGRRTDAPQVLRDLYDLFRAARRHDAGGLLFTMYGLS